MGIEMLSINLSLGIKIYCIIVAALTGAVFGSFLNCLAWRLTHGESVLKGRSHCHNCGTTLGALDLIPVFSWLFLRGKCGYCKKKISVRYPLSEIILALLSVLLLLKFDVTFEFLKNLIFTYCLFTLSITDLDDYIIPNGLLIVPAVSWFIFIPFTQAGLQDVLYHILSGFIFGCIILLIVLIFDRIMKKESMGGGDIKLLALSALYLGAVSALFMLFLACVIGIVFALATKYRKSNEARHFPFGPAIAMAAYIMLLYGEPLVNWYLSLL